MTKQYSSELQTAYENYRSTVVLAYETGDTSQLADVAIEPELNDLVRSVDAGDAEAVIEWWKVEVLSVTVTEYLGQTAKAVIQERVVGNIATPDDKRVWIVRFQQDDGIWKVSGLGSYFTND